MRQGDYIKSLLREKNIKLYDVAKKMNISKTTFSNKLHGNRIFKEPEIKILLEILNMSYEEVFGEKEIKIIENNKKIISISGENFIVTEKLADKIKHIIHTEKEVI